jgi:hypothetical protein
VANCRAQIGPAGSSVTRERVSWIYQNSRDMTVGLTECKKGQLQQVAKDLSKAAGQQVKLKNLASMVGKVVAAEPAIGNFAHIMVRRAYGILEEARQHQGWSGTVEITTEVAEDFRLLGEQLEEHNNHPIRSKETEMSVVTVVGSPSEFMKTTMLKNHSGKQDRGVVWRCIG